MLECLVIMPNGGASLLCEIVDVDEYFVRDFACTDGEYVIDGVRAQYSATPYLDGYLLVKQVPQE